MTYIPSATYRLQFSHRFKLDQLHHLISYLHELGISTIYASPIFCAKPGSEHGYDVTAPYDMNPEIGSQNELTQIVSDLRTKGMGWLQDIVPNHMAFHPDNVWLMDVLEKGPQSYFYTFFDIDFSHPDFAGQVMVPFLGEPLDKVLEQKQIKLSFTENGITINYFDNIYPCNLACYKSILLKVLKHAGGPQTTSVIQQLAKDLTQFETEENINPAAWNNFKTKLFNTEILKGSIHQELESINKHTNELIDFLDKQHFKLCFWKETEEKINYRRFFTVNDLICLRMEHPEVFEQYHQFISQLCANNIFQGLRIDHVDGLFDPGTYLKRLRELVGAQTYIIVEKILEGEEKLPERWPIQGNSGYDFLAWVSNLYTSKEGQHALTEIYTRLVPTASDDYEQLVFNKKMFILTEYMQGELENLLRILQSRHLIPLESSEKWQKALALFLASFPVYCIYGNKLPLSDNDMKVVNEAFSVAYKQGPESKDQLEHLHTLFTVNPEDTDETLHNKLHFIMRSQQFTGPLAAKGVEDTTFYNYNRLISLNEVGNSPDIFHLRTDEFHELMLYRQQTYPHSLNATATHDTKRGEGVRIRLNVLSELPEEWEDHVKAWIEISRKYTKNTTTNDLYFIFQTMLGVLPLDGEISNRLVKRVQKYLQKALREAKVNTDWADPNEEYEREVQGLAKTLLQEDANFINSFKSFFKKIAHFGWLYALCQTLLKTTCPGVPDVYQGTELWDLSLVDPDNRRPVDYRLRQHYLYRIRQQENQNTYEMHADLLKHPDTGQVKLYLLFKALNARRTNQELFSQGEYIPIKITGTHKTHALAFMRHHRGQWALIVVPLLLTGIISENQLPLGSEVWQDTAVALPQNAPKQWYQVFGKEGLLANEQIFLAELFRSFPVGFLTASS